MTVMVMSINRLVEGISPRDGFKMTALCQDRHTHTNPLTSCHIGSRLSPLPFFPPFFFVFLGVDSLLPQRFRQPFTGDSVSDSTSLHHAHTLTFVLFLCGSSLYLSILSFLCISKHSPSPVSLPSESVSLFSPHTCSAPPWGNCSEPGFHFYDYNRGQNAYASRFLLACVTAAALGRGTQIRP